MVTNSNEYLITQAMLDEGIDKRTIRRLRRCFKGWRIYFRTNESMYDDIISDYENMLNANYSREQAIKQLSDFYEKSELRIKEIVRKQGVLF